MCGIFGLIQPYPFEARELAGMSRLLRHRGPDDEGFALFEGAGVRLFGGVDTPQSSYDPQVSYCPRGALAAAGHVGSGGVALGHRRLSILDLSSHGHQPMSYQDRYWISYNGEVYNYLELRAELQASRYCFTTRSDTEVILAAYDRWGPECLSRMNGMWSLAILDTVDRRLFMARDRFGVKPLYLRRRRNRLAFASEIKAFSALEDWQPQADRARLLDMLVWNISDHTEHTMFEGVVQLPPGHYLSIDLGPLFRQQAGSESWLDTQPRRWYSLPEPAPAPRAESAAAMLRELLNDSVKLRLRSDVTVGSCLSGGLDSSTIVCLMSEQLRAQPGAAGLCTFTARSHDSEFDESRYARAVSKRAGSIMHEVTPEPARLFDDLDRLIWHQDEPFISTSIFAQWCVFQLARKAGVVVMLDGQGADETLCGYRGFFGAYLAGLVRQGQLARWAAEVAAIRAQIGFTRARSLGYTAAYLMPGLVGLIGRLDNRAYSDRSWLRPGVHGAFDNDPLRYNGARANSIRAMSVAQVTATNLPMLLHWEDRNSMAFSVEARVPFLDYRVVELCLNLADEEKVGGGISKAVLRRSMRGTVPDLILDRRDKLGFVTAERLWATRDMANRFRSELSEAVRSMPDILSPTIIDRFEEVVAGRRPFDHRYWRAICTARWVNAFKVAL
jgi:asparagine synthase (glutamine-hydrolysing)